MANRDYYTDLKITQYATTSQIKTAFHALAKQHHPDKSGSSDSSTFRRVRKAYETLSDATAKAEYDRTYQHMRRQCQYQADDAPFNTRTAAYEAEESARESRQDSPRPAQYSPPPLKPLRKPNEPSWAYYMGKQYMSCEKRDAVYRQRHPELYQATPPSTNFSSHGLQVQMSSHPSTEQRCTLKMQSCSVQAGSDSCVFCLAFTTSCGRCPGCQALACRTCLAKIIEKEKNSPFSGYRPSGG